jgi:hypothetical protein
MVTVPHIVRRLMEERPFLQECMNLDLIQSRRFVKTKT